MADAHFEPQSQPQYRVPKTGSTPFPSKRRKVVGQCPTCHHSFASRHELHAHMSDPVTHAPASDSDAVSFGELSDYDSLDEASPSKESPTHEHEPTLDTDGFEFTDDASFFPSQNKADQGSIHTLPDSDTQPSAEHTPIETPPRKAQQVRGGALGVLYCGTCDKYFGNERVFKRHFMFGVKHGEEPRDMRDLYYRVWRSSWKAETKGRVEEVGDTGL